MIGQPRDMWKWPPTLNGGINMNAMYEACSMVVSSIHHLLCWRYQPFTSSHWILFFKPLIIY